MRNTIWKEDFKDFSGLKTAVKWFKKHYPLSIIERTNFFSSDINLYAFAGCFTKEEELIDKINNMTEEQAFNVFCKLLKGGTK